MPTITVDSHDLYRLAGLPYDLPLGELDRRLALVKGELSRRSADGRPLQSGEEWLPLDGATGLRIELADTNRPDLWCVEGIARQLRDHGRGYGATYTTTAEEQPHTIAVDAELAEIRPYIGGFVAQGRSLTEPELLAFIEGQETLTANYGRQRKTVSIGLYRADDLAFPVRYQAVAPDAVRFVPLPPAAATTPAWVEDRALSLREILALHPTGQEYAWTLAGQTRMPFLTDAWGQVLSFPPIINSNTLGRVTPGVTDLFVEATGEAQEQVLLTLAILAANLADRGWEIVPVTTHYPYDTPRGRAVTVPHPLSYSLTMARSDCARVLGEEVAADEIITALAAYGVPARTDGERIAATVPPYRQDYLHAVDVIEDFAISRGYDALAPALPASFTVGGLDPKTEFEDWLRDLMIGFGGEELFCNILTASATIRAQMEVDETRPPSEPAFHGGPAVRIENVMNRNFSHLRDWVLPSLLEVESHSSGALYPHRLFEVGEVARLDPDHPLGASTESRLALLIADEDASFDSAQSVLYALFAQLGLRVCVEPWRHPSFISGRVGLVLAQPGADAAQPQPVGLIGELSPQVLTNWGTRTPAAAFELSVEALMALIN